MECGARATRKSTRPASRTSEPSSQTPITRCLGVGGATAVMGTFSFEAPKGSRVNTEPDKTSYKAIAPILCGGGEPYPNPNVFNFCTVYLLHWNLFEHLTVTCACCIVLCCM